MPPVLAQRVVTLMQHTPRVYFEDALEVAVVVAVDEPLVPRWRARRPLHCWLVDRLEERFTLSCMPGLVADAVAHSDSLVQKHALLPV